MYVHVCCLSYHYSHVIVQTGLSFIEAARTEPDRATTRPKSASRTVSNQDKYLSKPNRTEPMHFRKSVTETNRAEPVPSWTVFSHVASIEAPEINS